MPTHKFPSFPGMPITNIVYGDDHPSLRPPHPEWAATHPGTRIASLIDTSILERVVHKFPKCKKYLPRAQNERES